MISGDRMSDGPTQGASGAGQPGASRADRWLRDYLGITPDEAFGWLEPQDSPSATGPTAAGPDVAEDEAPLPERLVSDPETLKAISDPTRLRILETMVTRA